jgi:hypothetical protein
MNRVAFFLWLLFISAQVDGQLSVTFSLNVESLVESQNFSPPDKHRVFVRGSFNNWEGTSHELHPLPGQMLYQGTFELKGKPGDTLAYKYVIQKGPDRFFWEDNPNPANLDHGNRLLVLRKGNQELPEARFFPDEYFSWPVVFCREKLQKDFQQFRSILETTHPALYDYTSKEELDSLFEANAAKIDKDLDFNSFLMLMTDVIARVGCGHSSLWLPGSYWSISPQRMFPLRLGVLGDQAFVKGHLNGESAIPGGSKILSINGVKIKKLLGHLKSLTSADGFNPSFREAKVGQHFAVKYALAYGYPKDFVIEYQVPGERQKKKAILQPVDKTQVDRANEKENELSLKQIEEGTVALLTINSFAYYGEVDRFHTFLDSVFRVIDQEQIQDLILDLRGNGGGDPFCASYLWAYLEPEPLPYFEDHYGRYDTLANPVPQPSLPFSGNLYTLIDGLCFSTTGHFVGLLKYHGVGKFVGTESGASYTCTGNATYPSLKETGIMVGTARVMRYTAAVKNMDPMRGVLPDYPVLIKQQDMTSDRDVVLDHALQLIQED